MRSRVYKSISTVTGCLVCVSDQEQIVAANGPEQKNYLGKSISSRLEEAILNRKTVLARPGEKAYFSILENTDNTTPLPELIFRFSPPVMPSVRSFSAAKTGSPCRATQKKAPPGSGNVSRTGNGKLNRGFIEGNLSKAFASSAQVMQEAFSCYSVIRDIPILSCYLHLHCLQ